MGGLELINGCIAKGVWEKITSSKEYKKVDSMELEELELISPMIPARARFLVKPSFRKEAGIIGEISFDPP